MNSPKFGAKSSKTGVHHFFKWNKKPGEGEGKCMYCPVCLKFETKGPRGGMARRYKVKGKWSPTEPQCRRKGA